MNITIDYFDEDTEQDYQIEVYLDFERYAYGADADGNRGQDRYEVDWSVESVSWAGHVVNPDLKLKKNIVEFVEKYVVQKGDELLQQYKE